jgi:hypothetical protein
MRLTSVRALLGVVALALLATVLYASKPAAAESAIFVTVSPNPARAGFGIQLAGNCGPNVTSAKVSSAAFPSPVTLTPRSGVLRTFSVVPSRTPPRSYPVVMRCPNGETASTSLVVAQGSSNSTAAAMTTANQAGPQTGSGGSRDPNHSALVVGAGIILVAVLLAWWTYRRRRYR